MKIEKTNDKTGTNPVEIMLEREQELYVKRFLAGAPATGPNPNMQERNLARALLAWSQLVLRGGSQVLRMAGISPEDLDVDHFTFDEFFKGYLEECRNYGFALEEPRLRNIARAAWRQIIDPPTTGCATLEKEKEFRLDQFMTVEGPWFFGENKSVLDLCEMAVLDWIRGLRNGKSAYLSAHGMSWDNSYSISDYVEDVASLAKRYRVPMTDKEMRAHARDSWEWFKNGITKEETDYDTEPAPPVNWSDADMKTLVEQVIASNGYTDARAKDTAYYLPKLLRGEITPEEFVKDWRTRNKARGGS